MAANFDEAIALVAQIATELADCRQRGIERLDRHSHNQAPLPAEALQRLARDYAAARNLPMHGRIAQIKLLLRHALDEMAKLGDEANATLIRDLFFGASVSVVLQSAGELLENAQRKLGEPSEARFRERRQTALTEFSGFLVRFVAEADRGSAKDPGPVPAAPDAAGPGAVSRSIADTGPPAVAGTATDNAAAGLADPGLLRREVTAGYVEHGERFVALLAEAVNVTIVGFTNEQLAGLLGEAVQRKRAALSKPDAFWSSLRIVYLSADLLDFLNDERSEYPDRREAVRLRRLAAAYGHRSVQVFLRRAPAFRWALYQTSHVPPFIGTLLEMPSGKRIVQLLIPRPQRSTPDHLFIELEDLPDQYFAAAFEDVVHNSVPDNRVVPIGVPAGGAFRCTGRRYRQNILADGSGATGWLPVVLVVTYQRRGAGIEPLLQLRTADNASRELDHLSHLSGHIYYTVDEAFGARRAADPDPPLVLRIGDHLPMEAARQRVHMETGDDLAPKLRAVGTAPYLHRDKEHMFFFVYSLEMPEDFQFSRRADMHRFPLPELFAVRENQAFRKALGLCQTTRSSARIWGLASEIAALNLVLHDHADVARLLTTHFDASARDQAQLVDELTALERQTRQSWFTGDHDIELIGLSGMQYREFFTTMLPLYARTGVSGAADQLGQVREDPAKSAAIERLCALYRDEALIAAIPVAV